MVLETSPSGNSDSLPLSPHSCTGLPGSLRPHPSTFVNRRSSDPLHLGRRMFPVGTLLKQGWEQGSKETSVIYVKALIFFFFTSTIDPYIICGIKNYFQKGEMKGKGKKERESGREAVHRHLSPVHSAREGETRGPSFRRLAERKAATYTALAAPRAHGPSRASREGSVGASLGRTRAPGLVLCTW